MAFSTRAKSLFAAYFTLFLDNFGFAIVFPIFPILLLNPDFTSYAPHASESVRNIYLGILLAVFPLAQFLGAPLFGDIADRYGRKRALYWTISGCIVGYCLTAISILMDSYFLTLIARAITGFFAGNLAICMTIISDLNIDKKKRGKGLSLVSAFLGLSWICAIIVGSFFTDPEKRHFLNPSYPFWIVGIATIFSLIVVQFLYHETNPAPVMQKLNVWKGIHNIIHVLEHKQLRSLYLTLFFWFFGFFITLQWAIPLSIEKFQANPVQIMWFLILLGFFWACAAGIANPWLINYFSLWKITLWGLFFTGLLYFFAAAADFYLYFTIAYIISGIFASMNWGNSMSLISLSSSAQAKGKSMGIAQSVLAFAQFLGPLLGGVIAGYSTESLFYFCSLLVFISFLYLLVYVIKRKNKLLKKA